MYIAKRFACLLFAGTALFSSCRQQARMMESLSPAKTGIEFANNLDMSKSYRVLYFFYYYNGGGVAAGDINNDGLTDLFFTANSKGNNKLYLNKGNFRFEDITAKAGVAGNADWCTGVTMADVNGDGKLDIYVSSTNNIYDFKGRNELYINNGDGNFKEEAERYGLAISSYANQASFFDYDHDGDLDCYLLNQSFKPGENLVDTSYRRKYDANSGDRLLRNDISTGGKFTDVSSSAGIYQSNIGYGLGVSVADLNNDGWEDIYIGNDFQENDYYYLNNGNGTYTESGASHFNHYSRFSMGNDIADYDNDGQLDIITTDMLPADEKTLKTYGSGEGSEIYRTMILEKGYQPQYSRNCLHRNNGDGKSFSDVGLISGIAATDWSWSPLFADFDNDGNKDLFISSGIAKRTVDLDYIRFLSNVQVPPGTDPTIEYNKALARIPDGAWHNYIYKGNGNGDFTNKTEEWGLANEVGYHNGAVYADLDNDGDLDIVVNAVNSPALVYRNNTASKNYLTVQFNGKDANTMGIGAKAWVFANGRMQYQQLMLTRGFQSSGEAKMHFGLDSINSIDSVLIVWPDQQYQVIRNAPINKILIADQKNAQPVFNQQEFFPEQPDQFVQSSAVTCAWSHKEDQFNDFLGQYLLPHQQSIRGPRLAVADINKDGLDDFFVCGPKGQPGCLFVQGKDGRFNSVDTSLFNQDAQAEDTDAVFADVDGDSDLDLYVTSGGNEYNDGNSLLEDRLYLNDGSGRFTKPVNALPTLLVNKTCVSAGDIDGDGDIDIFLGGGNKAGQYGTPPTSYLLLNDGKGNFTAATNSIIDLKDIGVVTAASIADMNADGRNDLVIAGEWMPITIFINHNNKFSAKQVSETGLWQSMFLKDIDGDGSLDIMAGNWGLNSKLAAGKNGPLKLYVGDYDHNGTQDDIVAYTISNKEYPFLNKDELEQAVPMVKKKFLYYTDFAGKTIQEVFDLNADVITLTAADLRSGIFYNDKKGGFRKENFPGSLQLSPLFSFAEINTATHSWIAGGNFFGTLPYEGAYDALSIASFRLDKSGIVDKSHVIDIKGQVRDIKMLRTNRGNVYAVAKNNEPIRFYEVN